MQGVGTTSVLAAVLALAGCTQARRAQDPAPEGDATQASAGGGARSNGATPAEAEPAGDPPPRTDPLAGNGAPASGVGGGPADDGVAGASADPTGGSAPGADDAVDGADCGPVSVGPEPRGFGDASCDALAPWRLPALAYDGVASDEKPQGVVVKGGDGVAMASYVPAGAVGGTDGHVLSALSIVDVGGACRAFLGASEGPTRRIVLEARAEHGVTALLVGCPPNAPVECATELWGADAEPYDLAQGLGLDPGWRERVAAAYPRDDLHHELAVTSHGDIVVVTSVSAPVDGGNSGDLPSRLVLRRFSSGLELLASVTVDQPGLLDDIAVTGDELLVFTDTPNGGDIYLLQRFSSTFELIDEPLTQPFPPVRGAALDSEGDRIAISGSQMMLVDASTFELVWPTEAPVLFGIVPPERPASTVPAGNYGAVDLTPAQELLRLTGGGTALHDITLSASDGSDRWSLSYEESTTSEAAVPELVEPAIQQQSTGDVLASSSREIFGRCRER